ncbi:hypothetical protein RNT89_11430 [Staphylococcus pseudintermedius]|uniref:hypothetical protein n=1 Tax=Staphylococcus pseudintermedius TaxID=283734 RepID=UPI0019169887|nr:hypothetical protein [Staphylococcus pseudintermedius]EGQ2689295.1 hypothetical protein [Staphylococcus pseudintermedius]EGQ3411670.1 hypothetical protein [Staphylococcus pseudintermedius]EHK3763458.1 hypothetical protein [Staphylococcus pseudintermedius]EJF1310971.1 hypothetical protein [Staphylococcus pseudintermedius]EJG0118913.1 hypothetical protein [Staphylococcus pseudintermedius]
MKEQNKKVIYYYYDHDGNRRLLSIGTLDSCLLTSIESRLSLYKKNNPDLDSLFVQIDGVEFKLL